MFLKEFLGVVTFTLCDVYILNLIYISCAGLFVSRRDLITFLLGIEMFLLPILLKWALMLKVFEDVFCYTMILFILALAAMETAFTLSYIVGLFKLFYELDIDLEVEQVKR